MFQDDGWQWMNVHDTLQYFSSCTVHYTSVPAFVRIGMLVLGIRQLQFVEQHLRHFGRARQLKLSFGQLEGLPLEHSDFVLNLLELIEPAPIKNIPISSLCSDYIRCF